MLSDIEKLDALGREKGLVIHSIHQANAGWCCQWCVPTGDYGDETLDRNWWHQLTVYGYYPTITDMVEAETSRINTIPGLVEWVRG